MRLKLLAIVALIGGPALAYHTRQEMNQRALVEREGITVPGILTDGTVKTKRGSKTYKFEVTYATGDNAVHKKEFSVPKAFAQKYVQDDAFTRYDVEVRCLKSDPNIAFIVDAGDANPEMEPIGYGVGGVGLVGTFLLFRRRKETIVPAESR
jgi:hypothetical protein